MLLKKNVIMNGCSKIAVHGYLYGLRHRSKEVQNFTTKNNFFLQKVSFNWNYLMLQQACCLDLYNVT